MFWRAHFMSSVLPLRAAITRGALITLANWPTVLIDFIVESIYNLALAVPVIGGAFMLALLMGAIFDKAVRKYTDAFEARARAVYGSPTVTV